MTFRFEKCGPRTIIVRKGREGVGRYWIWHRQEEFEGVCNWFQSTTGLVGQPGDLVRLQYTARVSRQLRVSGPRPFTRFATPAEPQIAAIFYALYQHTPFAVSTR